MRRCLTATPTRPAPFRTPPDFWELLWLCKLGPASLCGGGLIPTCWRVPGAEGASLLWFTFPYLRVSSFGGTLCIVGRPTLLFHFHCRVHASQIAGAKRLFDLDGTYPLPKWRDRAEREW